MTADAAALVFLDETGINTQMTPSYARAPKGQRAVGAVPHGSWHRLTVLGALGSQGVLAAMSVEAATSAAVFLAFVEQVLIPALRRHRPDALVVMDNLSAHKSPRVLAAFAQAGIAVRFLPRYSPDLSPIEPGWSKLKATLRAQEARDVDALNQALGPALDAISPQDAQAWLRNCGYAILN